MANTTTLAGIIAASGGDGLADPAGTGLVNAPIDMSEFYSKYGYAAALVNSDPGLKELFQKAALGNWSAAKFQAELQNIEWFTTHAANWRAAEAAKFGDPATWAQAKAAVTQKLKAKATALGYSFDDTNVDALVDGLLHTYGPNASSVDLNAPDVLAHITEFGKLTGGGTAQQTANDLKSYAASMGVSYSSDWYSKAEQSVASGATDATYWETQIKNAAKSQYAQFSSQIDAGLSVKDIASPYFGKMASILELDGNALTLDDPLINQALNSKDKDGNLSPMSLWQFEQTLKNDPRWNYTANARAATDNAARSVLRDFGLAW